MAVDERAYVGSGEATQLGKGSPEIHQVDAGNSVRDGSQSAIQIQLEKHKEIETYLKELSYQLDAVLERNTGHSVINKPEEDNSKTPSPVRIGLLDEMEASSLALWEQAQVLGEIIDGLTKRF